LLFLENKMPDLPKKKVGIVACSGEEMAEGTVTRLAALKVLEQLRPEDTVTICLPLFLAGGEGDRAFARFYPTVAVDGCELRCAARATEKYSGKPAAGIVVTDVVAENELGPVSGRRRLNGAGQLAVDETADRVALMVDDLLGKKWSRRKGAFIAGADVAAADPEAAAQEAKIASCACGSGIPVQTVDVAGEEVTLIALPVLFEQFHSDGKRPSPETVAELLAQVKIYNAVPAGADAAYEAMLLREYGLFCARVEVVA
jgi:uncharacterized metal-binding protein